MHAMTWFFAICRIAVVQDIFTRRNSLKFSAKKNRLAVNFVSLREMLNSER